MNKPKILVGIGTIEIKFAPGLIMGGYLDRDKGGKGTHDPLCIRALYFAIDTEKIIIVEGDFIGLALARVIALKERIRQQYGIFPENILIGIIHSHSSVLNIHLFEAPSPGVQDQVDDAIFQAAGQAIANAFPATIEVAKGDIQKVSFNRRDWDPLSEIIDTGTLILHIRDQKRTLRAVVYNYSCHPVVMGPKNMEYSADWPYFTQQFLRAAYKSPDLFVMFLQGTPGNLNPRNVPFSGPKVPNSFQDCQEIGDEVGKQLKEIGKKVIPLDQTSNLILKGKIENVDIPLDDKDKFDFFSEFANVSKNNDQILIHTQVQGVRLGPIALIGMPAELFAEIGRNIKDTKIFPFIGVVGYCNDYIGYVGTAPVYAKGGYEMMMMSGSGQAGEILQNAAVRLLNELK